MFDETQIVRNRLRDAWAALQPIFFRLATRKWSGRPNFGTPEVNAACGFAVANS